MVASTQRKRLSPNRWMSGQDSEPQTPKKLKGGKNILYNASFKPNYYGMSDLVQTAEVRKLNLPDGEKDRWNSGMGGRKKSSPNFKTGKFTPEETKNH